MDARQHAAIDRQAHALRRAEFTRMAADLACLARRAIASLRGAPAPRCTPRPVV